MTKQMWPTRHERFKAISDALSKFSAEDTLLPGITDKLDRDVLAMQMIASLRRLDYTQAIKGRDISVDRINPASSAFDPERGAALFVRQGKIDEAIWLLFLSTHFGQHRLDGWKLLKQVYSGLGEQPWTFDKVSQDPKAFKEWIERNYQRLDGRFGNHRKYESIRPDSNRGGIAAVVDSFLTICGASPAKWFRDLARTAGNDPKIIFDLAYNQFSVLGFGRLARFDFLALVGRLSIAPLVPGRAYLKGATGPLMGARLLIYGDPKNTADASELEDVLCRLDEKLGVGMQVMEDSICNWQKSPKKFVHFRG